MCTGAEIALIVGSTVAAAGAVQQGNVAKDQADLQAQILQQQARQEREQAKTDAGDFRKEQSRLMAARRAAMGASGVRTDTGSPLITSEDFASEAELQAQRILRGGEIRGTRLQQEAGLQRFAGKSARQAGFLRAGSLLLTGTGKAFA